MKKQKWSDGELPKFGVTEYRHNRFLEAIRGCETPGTRSFQRINLAVACMLREREWNTPPWRNTGVGSSRPKLYTYRRMVGEFAEDGGEFTYLRALSWLSKHDARFSTTRVKVVGYLMRHRRELGIHAVYRFDGGPIVWKVEAKR